MKRGLGFIATLLLFWIILIRGDVSAQRREFVSAATFTPEHRVVLELQRPYATNDNAHLALYHVPMTQLVALHLGKEPITGARFGAERPLRRLDVHPDYSKDTTASNGAMYVTPYRVDLGRLPIGEYAAVWTLGDGRSVQMITIGTLGSLVVSNFYRNERVIIPLDLRTFKHRGDVAYTLYAGAAMSALKLGTDGLLHIAPKDNALIVGAAPDGSVSITQTYPASGNLTERVALESDRPIYRPGQVVKYRAVVRQGEAGSYLIPSGSRAVQLTRAYSNDVLAHSTAILDEFGTLSGEFTLPDDAETGSYWIAVGEQRDWSSAANFDVETYRRPEYLVEAKPLAPYLIGGEPARFAVDVNYFSGRPASGIPIHYAARYEADSYFAYYHSAAAAYQFAGETPRPYATQPPALNGVITADANGHAEIRLPTSRLESESQLVVQLDVRDASEHTVSSETRVRVTPASFYLRVLPESYFQRAGDVAVLNVESRRYDGTPQPATDVRLEFARQTWDPSTQRYQLVVLPEQTQTVRTDASGHATLRWKAPEAGYFFITATAHDETDRLAQTTWYLWAVGAGTSAYHFQKATLEPQRDHYAPGEPATLLATVPRGDVDGALVVSSGTVQTVRLVHLPATTSTLTVEPPPDVAQYRATLIVPSVASTSALIRIDPPQKALKVRIRPDRERYEPGSEARFSLDVSDARGRPVRAEVALGIVDDAIYALRKRQVASAFDVLYRAFSVFPGSTASFSALNEPTPAWINPSLTTIGRVRAQNQMILPGTAADTYSISPPTFENVRKDFRETAYWSPAIVTDASGHALVSFRWPDSLTSYSADASAITKASEAGDASSRSLVTKDFLVRLEAPRFLRVGDEASIVGIAQGQRGATGAALRFSAPALGVANAQSPVAFDRFQSAASAWTVRARELGSANLRLAGSSLNSSDGIEMPLPVESAGTAEHQRFAGMFPQSAGVNLELPQAADAGNLRVDVAPSVLAELGHDLQLLQVYPYYCTEQTLSAALPLAFLDRVSARFGLPVKGPSAKVVARRAIDRLKALQHVDGSWGWWEHDAAHPFMTAYALYGLSELRNAGYDDESSAIYRGRLSLIAQLREQNSDTLAFWGGPQPGSQWNTRAFMLFALADADPKAFDKSLLGDAAPHLDDMNSYALAVLGLAHHLAGDDPGARTVLAALDQQVTESNSYAYWLGSGWHYRWEDDPIETTAYALRLEHALAPSSPRIPKIISWLRAKGRGSSWYTTKDTAAAIAALAETIDPSGDEMTPHETVRVTLEGKTLKMLRFDSPNPPADASSFTIPADALKTGGRLAFEREGRGAVYWSADWTRYVTASGGRRSSPSVAARLRELHADVSSAFTVARTYRAEHHGILRTGDIVEVKIDATAKSDQQYVAIEDPFPAGLEYQPLQYQSGMDWSGIQFLDDRAVFFVTKVVRGEHLRLAYRLRAMTAGSFTAPAATMYAMYGPPVAAMGNSERVTIAKEKR